MRRFFSTFGKVVDATVMIDRETSRGKGFGFVTFEDAVNAEQLVGKIGLVLDDKQVNPLSSPTQWFIDCTRLRSKLLSHEINAIRHGRLLTLAQQIKLRTPRCCQTRP